ncbi:hypothetical protein DRB06_05905 [Actinomyces sp. Z5]|uniref:GntR family transcriptional regulator n=1 Tax=Actinomyces sp. Z5 TaxID=2250216 RepID=UPI000DCB01FC|nr:GntR family transcriptional regulator [Actinomyces sp. Z5]RAX21491.1 hypothetical protein DRB06_05905 [Actinomyces sp. Z5]
MSDLAKGSADAKTAQEWSRIGGPLVQGASPLYHQVYRALRTRLESGELSAGDRLPTEKELASSFGCSLVTIRRALDELVREGAITRTRGKGTFVSARRIDRELNQLTSFTDEMSLMGLSQETKLLGGEITEAIASTADRLGIVEGAPVYAIERLRVADDEPLLIEHVFLPAHMFPGLLSVDFGTTSLYSYLYEQFGVELVRGHQTVEPALPSAREARLLEQDRSQPVLLLRLTSYSSDGRPIEYCRTVVKGSRARYHLEVSRPRSL